MSEWLNAIIAWVSANPDWVTFVIFCVALLESLAIVGSLVPGVAIMLAVAGLIGAGEISLWPVLFWAILGAVIGDQISFWLGHHYRSRLWNIWPLSKNPELIVQSRQFFARHGGKSVALGRFIGPIRAVIPAMAGMSQMSPRRFTIINLLSAIVWAPAYLLPGAAFGRYLHDAQYLLIFIVIVVIGGTALAGWLIKRLNSADDPENPA